MNREEFNSQFSRENLTCDLLMELIEDKSSNDLTNIYFNNIPLFKIPNSESKIGININYI